MAAQDAERGPERGFLDEDDGLRLARGASRTVGRQGRRNLEGQHEHAARADWTPAAASTRRRVQFLGLTSPVVSVMVR
ncbi:hypothetical protein GCM10009838_86710 [Catenulispora subtropica]|uniref:Uncharacterized protein n=1 Tax=Catenulispora subtropica TaxID=450798 RepID=A0ABN2TGF9_9ACTN